MAVRRRDYSQGWFSCCCPGGQDGWLTPPLLASPGGPCLGPYLGPWSYLGLAPACGPTLALALALLLVLLWPWPWPSLGPGPGAFPCPVTAGPASSWGGRKPAVAGRRKHKAPLTSTPTSANCLSCVGSGAGGGRPAAGHGQH